MKHGQKSLAGALVMVALAVALVLIVAGSQGALAQAGSIIYVDVDAMGFNNGGSWKHAFTDLQYALDEAASGDQIWVAAGTYKPSHEFIQGDPRSAAFQMVNGVAVYGGFDPGTGVTKFEDRDPSTYRAVLSGNIGDEDRLDDNSHHVFYHPEGTNLDSTAVLDGFVIADGNADEPDYPGGDCGGGMYNDHSLPTLNNITFLDNSAQNGGGALYVSQPLTITLPLTYTNVTFLDNSAESGGGAFLDVPPGAITDTVPIRFTNCIFSGNSAVDGGAMHISATQPITPPGGITFTNCVFSGNSAERGGGLSITWGEPDEEGDPLPIRFTNCIFWSNDADLGGGAFITGGELDVDTPPLLLTNCTFSDNQAESGGGIYVGKGLGPGEGWLELTNSILWGDAPDEISGEDGVWLPVVTYSDVEGGYEGEGNIDEDPLFVDADSGDLHLLPDSVCIDSANNGPELAQYDIDGDPRVLDGDGDGWAVVDMGADEFKMPTIWVEVDVTPSVPSNVIKLGSPRRVPVAILSTEEFSAPEVIALDTVRFAGAFSEGYESVDVNKDGHHDVLLDFRARDMEDLTEDSTEATLTGFTLEAVPIEGTAEVQVIP